MPPPLPLPASSKSLAKTCRNKNQAFWHKLIYIAEQNKWNDTLNTGQFPEINLLVYYATIYNYIKLNKYMSSRAFSVIFNVSDDEMKERSVIFFFPNSHILEDWAENSAKLAIGTFTKQMYMECWGTNKIITGIIYTQKNLNKIMLHQNYIKTWNSPNLSR